MAAVTGTTGANSLVGGGGDDSILGLAGNDTIDGGAGNDTLLGGDGNDHLTDASGNDILDGGAGNDVISVYRSNSGLLEPLRDSVTISGGDGDDQVSVELHWNAGTNWSNVQFTDALVALGAGNDRLFLFDSRVAVVASLGTGRDRIELSEDYLRYYADYDGKPIVVTDFAVGNAGDILDLSRAVRFTGWNEIGNPFATGQLRLLQQGADTIVAIDYDGVDGSDQLMEVFRLVGINSSTLSAYNLAGFEPRGTATAGMTVMGTLGADTLYGGAGADNVQGGAGNDEIHGGFGADTIVGGAGDDTIDGGYGDDSLSGGDGNDTLQDLQHGSDTLIGGDGNDRIVVQQQAYGDISDTVIVDAGLGADTVDASVSHGTLSVSLGDGADRIIVRGMADRGTTISLGLGVDVVELDVMLGAYRLAPITITDFVPGDAGDRLDWLAFARGYVYSADPGFNPFAAGTVRLQQVGADTQLVLLQGKDAGSSLLVFKNASLSNFTNFNFGTDIHLTPPPPEQPTVPGTASNDALTGSVGPDVIYGQAGDDTINALAGNDLIRPGDGMDSIDAGDGNDSIYATDGFDTIAAGAGNDLIELACTSSGDGRVLAGDGNDTLRVGGDINGLSVDMGTGDDRVVVSSLFGDIRVALGSGRDVVELPAYFDHGIFDSIVLADFLPGSTGDVIDFGAYLEQKLPLYWQWIGRSNPFAQGYLQLRQAGANSELWIDVTAAQGPSSERIVVFQGVASSQLTAANFGGFDPHVSGNGPKTISSSTTITHTQTEAAVNTAADSYGRRVHYIYNSQDAQFVNHGVSTTTSTSSGAGSLFGLMGDVVGGGAFFLNASDGRFIVNQSDASLKVESNATTAYGFNASMRFQNDGWFEVATVAGFAQGVVAGALFGGSVVNTGTFWVHSAYRAIGVSVNTEESFRNDGTFTVDGNSDAFGVYSLDYAGRSQINNGTMTVTNSPTSPWASVGFLIPEIAAPYAGQYDHWNNGTITADYAYYIYEVNEWLGGFKDVLHNTGTINGSVRLGRGDDVVINTGQMSSRTFLGEGNDTYDGSKGTHTGSVEGEFGDDTLIGGDGDENLFGDTGSDSIVAGAGADYVDGGAGSDTLDGGAGVDMVSYFDAISPVEVDLATGTAFNGFDLDRVSNFEVVGGSRADDTIRAAGGDETLSGFFGNDFLEGRDGDDVLIGGQDDDTLEGGGGDDWFVFEAGDGHDLISDFAANDLIAIFGYSNYQSLSQAGNDVVVVFSAADSLTVRNATVAAVQAGISFTEQPLHLRVPGFEQESLRGLSDVVIEKGTYAFGDTHPRVSFDTLPSSTALFLYGSSGLWTSGTIKIATTWGGAPTIAVTRAPESSYGDQKVVIRPAGAIDVHAADGNAIGIDSVMKLWNEGTFQVQASNGNATGIGDLTPLNSSFWNSGLVSVTASGIARGIAQEQWMSSVGVSAYTNSGVVDVRGGEASTGFDVMYSSSSAGDRSTFVNTGTVRVTDGTTQTVDSVALKIALGGRAVVWNSGNLEADFAIRVSASISGYQIEKPPYGLTVYNSGTMTGAVFLSTWGDTVINSGTISGSVFLGGGNDLFDGRLGTLQGAIEAYDGNDTVLGGAAADTIYGGFGDDVLSGGRGDDILTGGDGADTFHFRAGDGRDVITDIETGAVSDVIEIEGYAGYQSISQSGSDVVIALSATDSIKLLSTTTGAVTSSMFHFGAGQMDSIVVPASPVATAPPQEPSTALTIQSISPADDSSSVELDAHIQVTFSDAIARGKGWLLLQRVGATAGTIPINIETSNAVTISGNTLTLDLTGFLAYDTDYSLQLPAGTIVDLQGHSYSGSGGSYNFHTTQVPPAPLATVESFVPYEGSSAAVAVTSNLLVTFSERVEPGTGQVILKTAAGEVVETFQVGWSGHAVVDNFRHLVIDPTSPLLGGTAYVIELSDGAVVNTEGTTLPAYGPFTFTTVAQSMVGGIGADVITGTAGGERINSLGGNDVITGGSGSDTIDGGAGLDVAVYRGTLSAFTVTHTSSGFTVAMKAGTEIDVLSNVERLVFDDQKVALDIDGTAGKAYRLYQAAFDRKPDLGGLGYQMHDLDIGFSLSSVAANFIASPEFQSKYGNVDNTQFITLLYQHVLHRLPDAGGLQWHLDELTHGYSKADVLTFFSESPENQANVIGDIQNGMAYIW